MFGSAEQDLGLQATPIWVHLTYQTAFVDNTGKLQTRRDLYGLDSRTLAAIKSERGVVEPTIERKRDEVAARTDANKPARPAAARTTGTGAQTMLSPVPAPSYARPLPYQPLTLQPIYR
jgi:hypothetical protein